MSATQTSSAATKDTERITPDSPIEPDAVHEPDANESEDATDLNDATEPLDASETTDRPALSLSATVLIAGAMSAVTSAGVGSSLGTAGTVFGAAFGSVVGAVATAVYTYGIRRTRQALSGLNLRRTNWSELTPRRKKVLVGVLITALAAFLVGLVAVTGVGKAAETIEVRSNAAAQAAREAGTGEASVSPTERGAEPSASATPAPSATPEPSGTPAPGAASEGSQPSAASTDAPTRQTAPAAAPTAPAGGAAAPAGGAAGEGATN